MTKASVMDLHRCLRIRLLVRELDSREMVERLVAETWAAGAVGHQEIEIAAGPSVELVVHFRPKEERAIREAILALEIGAEVGPSEEIPVVDWVARWYDSLSAVVVSNRLVVRPDSVEYLLAEGQIELIIDPGQAFGTGSHASTSLALENVLAQSPVITGSTRVLDVGTGTGILALAALRLGAGLAVGFDVDPVSVPEARRWATRNGLADRFRAFTGGIESLGPGLFDLVLANLLRRELLPIAAPLASRLAPSGRMILSGLLGTDCAQVETVLAASGLRVHSRRGCIDHTGEDWVSLVMGRA